MNTPETEKIVEEISRFLNRINRWATLLQILTVLFTLTIVVSSVAVGFLVGEKINPICIKTMAFLTTFCSVSMSAFSLEKKAHDMREAYRYLKYAIFKYRAEEYDINALVKAYNETEKIVGHIEVKEETISTLIDRTD